MKHFLLSLRTALFILPLFALSLTSLNVADNKVRRVVIDAGHGGKDPGCIGKMSQEKQVALDVSLRVGKYITENLPDVEVIYTRDKDFFVQLDERSRIANKAQADLFISIHANASENKGAYGTETFVMGMHKSQENLDVAMRENSSIMMEENYKDKYNFDPNSFLSYIRLSNYQSAYQAQSLELAKKIEKQFSSRVGRHSRGVKQAGFLVLWQTSMPSVLVELGFLSNLTEEKYLNTEKGRAYMASAIYRAFKEYKQEIESL